MPGGHKNIRPEDGRQWKKGQSGNPKGRPPDLIKTMLKAVGDEKGLREIADAIMKKALKGDVKAAEFVYDRLYGKPKQSQDIKIETERPIFTSIDLNIKEDV